MCWADDGGEAGLMSVAPDRQHSDLELLRAFEDVPLTPRGRAEWYHWLLIISVPIVFWSAIVAVAVRYVMGDGDFTLN